MDVTAHYSEEGPNCAFAERVCLIAQAYLQRYRDVSPAIRIAMLEATEALVGGSPAGGSVTSPLVQEQVQPMWDEWVKGRLLTQHTFQQTACPSLSAPLPSALPLHPLRTKSLFSSRR
jgi:hypothetical protein